MELSEQLELYRETCIVISEKCKKLKLIFKDNAITYFNHNGNWRISIYFFHQYDGFAISSGYNECDHLIEYDSSRKGFLIDDSILNDPQSMEVILNQLVDLDKYFDYFYKPTKRELNFN